MKKANYSYDLSPRLAVLGGGWQLKLLEDGEEVGGGVFPADTEVIHGKEVDHAYEDAYNEANSWLQSR